MNRTKIETVKNPDGSQGYTWNPITGCLYHIEGMCKGGNFPCYAYGLVNGRLKTRCLANDIIPKPSYSNMDKYHQYLKDPFYPRIWPDRIKELTPKAALTVPWTKDRGIFVCDMSDLFGIGIPRDWQDKVFECIKQYPWHRFYLLTKQPQNLLQFSPFPDNCWVGVTATNAEMLWVALANLAEIKARVKYVYIEPLLSNPFTPTWELNRQRLSIVDWVIIGSLTISLKDYQDSNFAIRRGLQLKQCGKKWTVQPDIEWVKGIVTAADKAKIPVFLKNNLEPLWTLDNSKEPFFKFTRPSLGATEIGRLRQEMPE